MGNEDIEKVIAAGKSAVNTKEEDDALKQKVVTYTTFADLNDFDADHLFTQGED